MGLLYFVSIGNVCHSIGDGLVLGLNRAPALGDGHGGHFPNRRSPDFIALCDEIRQVPFQSLLHVIKVELILCLSRACDSTHGHFLLHFAVVGEQLQGVVLASGPHALCNVLALLDLKSIG